MIKLISIIYIFIISFKLGIKVPYFDFMNDENEPLGKFQVDLDDNRFVVINTYNGLSSCLATIRHELRHCWQMKVFGAETIEYWEGFQYIWRPTEIDAELYATQAIHTNRREESILYLLDEYVGRDPDEVSHEVFDILYRNNYTGIVCGYY